MNGLRLARTYWSKEKQFTRERDALAAERRRMPWLAVEKQYEFDGPSGKVSLLDLFEGRRQLIVYRAFFEPGVFGWPDHACRGCSLGADQVSHLAHLNARDTTLAYASRAPQPDIERLKARMDWKMPWYTITDSFDADFGVDEWHGTTRSSVHDGKRQGVPHVLHQQPRRRSDGLGLELPRHDRAGTPGEVGGLARGLPADETVRVVELARRVRLERFARSEMDQGARQCSGDADAKRLDDQVGGLTCSAPGDVRASPRLDGRFPKASGEFFLVWTPAQRDMVVRAGVHHEDVGADQHCSFGFGGWDVPWAVGGFEQVDEQFHA